MSVLPNADELSAISILEHYFKLPISFVEPLNSYKRKTPDLLIGSVLWEVKSPSTRRLATLEKRLNEASRQSKYIIMDIRNIHIEESKAIRYLNTLLTNHTRVKRLLCIKKNGSILALK